MTSGAPRHGRRDNGLTATEYAVVADVDPRLGEHLLDVLGLAGIAAYLQPAAEVHPVTRANFLPSPPADRLFVDRAHLSTARGHLAHLLTGAQTGEAVAGEAVPGRGPGGADPVTGADGTARTDGTAGTDGTARTGSGGRPPADADALARPDGTGPILDRGGATPDATRGAPLNFEERWAAIVADFNAAPEPGAPAAARSRPDDADPDDADPDDTDPDDADRPVRRRPRGPGDQNAGPGGPRRPSRRGSARDGEDEPPSLLDALDTFGAGLPDEDDEGYHRPPPPPVPRPAWYTVVAVLALLGGLAALIIPDALPVSPDSAVFVGAGGLVTGIGILIWRLRPGGGDDEDRYPDDGAVV